MRLIAGWEGGKFVIMVDDGPQTKILHRISMTETEMQQVVRVHDSPKGGPALISNKHEQLR